jgi:hypothetical protein
MLIPGKKSERSVITGIKIQQLKLKTPKYWGIKIRKKQLEIEH